MRLVLDCFDHTVGSDGRDAQAVAQIPDGLMMRSIDLDVESAVTFCEAGKGRELGDFASRRDPRGMDGSAASGGRPSLLCSMLVCNSLAISW